MTDFAGQRRSMVSRQLAARGIHDPRVLAAMGEVPREFFVPPHLAEFAYEDAPLPIASGQTISQPYIVALMAEALGLSGGERVLEIGTGSGYAAAVLSRLASEVYTVERHEDLAESARAALEAVGYDNVQVLHADGTLGWPEHAPYDAILVSAGGPGVPPALSEQLAPGGVVVIPVGADPRTQELVAERKQPDGTFTRRSLGAVRFVPLIGAEGWAPPRANPGPSATHSRSSHGEAGLVTLLRENSTHLSDPEQLDPGPLLERIGDARVVLIGEASHGTSEFYRTRARITQALVQEHGFRIVAAEADWPDAARIDARVRHLDIPDPEWIPFSRFPIWMWRNWEVAEFAEWLKVHNEPLPPDARTGFFGLDLYSLHRSIDVVLEYLDRVDPEAARIARVRYGCLSPYEADPATYGRAVLSGRYRSCEDDVVAMLEHVLAHGLEMAERNGYGFLDAIQNARLIANAERYYRIMYRGGAASWNLRDSHMFDTLEFLLRAFGPDARAVVWAHNSHIGNARATEMWTRGEHNLGYLCRQSLGDDAFLIGLGTHRGTVAAAEDWGDPMQVMDVRPSHPASYEHLFHLTEVPALSLHLREPLHSELRPQLMDPRLERAIGVIYRPQTELMSHYFQAVLPLQFDEYLWIDETRAVHPLGVPAAVGLPDTYPFGL
ncbi:MAG: protein-L-isoaspartate(D-aspartate) O-methyltransferase [Gemmatimonadota bacterium]